jgi:hypothetical protein
MARIRTDVLRDMSASPYADVPSVAAVAGDIAGAVERFVQGETHSFAFSDGGVPEAVVASYDQYDDLRGEETNAQTDADVTELLVHRAMR